MTNRSEATFSPAAEQFRALAEFSPDSIVRFDQELKQVYINRAGLRWYGKPAALVSGKTLEEVGVPKPQRRVWTAQIRQVFATGESRETEGSCPSGDGVRFYHSRWVAEYGADGTVASVLAIFRDVTAQKQAAEALRQCKKIRKREEVALVIAKRAAKQERDLLQAVMNGAKNSHLVYLDRDFTLVSVNETYARTCGYRPEQMVGKNHFALYPDPENEAIFTRVRDTGEPVVYHDKPFEFLDQPERGVTYWDWTLTPVKDPEGSVSGLVFSLFETTDRKRLQENLELQVVARMAELTQVNDELRQEIAVRQQTQEALRSGKRRLWQISR